MGSAISGFLSTPEGQETVKKFLSSPEGIAMIKNFASTPEGKKVILNLILQLLENLNLPPGAADLIKNALGAAQ